MTTHDLRPTWEEPKDKDGSFLSMTITEDDDYDADDLDDASYERWHPSMQAPVTPMRCDGHWY